MLDTLAPLKPMRVDTDQAAETRPTADDLKATFSCLPTGVAAICAVVDGKPEGMIASTFTPVSLDPALVSICIDARSQTWPVLADAPHLAISLLAEHQEPVSRALSAKGGDRFAGLPIDASEDGPLVIPEATAWMMCEKYSQVTAGDHEIVIFRILQSGADTERRPLVYHRSGFKRLA